MSQYDFGIIDPSVNNGTQLAGFINSFRDAINSGHSGTSRPAYVRPGMSWVDTTSAAGWKLNFFDGTNDVLVAAINTNNHTISLAGLPDAYAKTAFKADGTPNAPVLYGPNGEVISTGLTVSNSSDALLLLKAPVGKNSAVHFYKGDVAKWALYDADTNDTFGLWNSTTKQPVFWVDPDTGLFHFKTAPRVGDSPFASLDAFTGVVQTVASGNYTVPAGVNRIVAVLFGGGGGGSGTWENAGQPGGLGGCVAGWVNVTPGQVIPFTIGAGGAGGAEKQSGGNGGQSTFGGLTANGGSGAYRTQGGGSAGGNGGASGGNLLNATCLEWTTGWFNIHDIVSRIKDLPTAYGIVNQPRQTLISRNNGQGPFVWNTSWLGLPGAAGEGSVYSGSGSGSGKGAGGNSGALFVFEIGG